MDWSNCSDVESVPGRMSGAWVVKDSRVTADTIVEYASDGFSPEEIVSDFFEGLSLERVRGILAFAAAHDAHPA